MSKKFSRFGVQVALSLLVMAPSIMLFGSQIRLSYPNRLRADILLVSLVAQCVESQAALWLLLMPTLIWVISRLPGMRFAAPECDESEQLEPVDRFFLLVGPTTAALLPAVVWGAGHREPAAVFLAAALFLIVPPLVLVSIVRLFVAPWRPSVAAIVLILLALPCISSLGPVFDAGRKSLERSVGMCRIAEECVKILKNRVAVGKYGWCTVDAATSPALSVIAPVHIDVRNDKVLKVELGGGFDHYGYRLSQDETSTRWVLEWYTEGFRPDETLLTWPIGSDPCDHDPPSGS